MGAGTDHFRLGSQHLTHLDNLVHPLPPLVWWRSNHTRGAKVRLFPHRDCSNHSNTAVCWTQSGRKCRVASHVQPRQISWRNKDLERQESFVKEHQPRGHGADSSSRQARQATVPVVQVVHGSKHGQARSLQAAQRRRGQNDTHMERGQPAPFLPMTSSPSKGCNFRLVIFCKLQKGICTLFPHRGSLCEKVWDFLLRRSFVPH